ncbi:uncharacterized protein ATNIH1004_003627 [Aspergillus tanneri]|uniref:CFEM domain-containing protein n=1 Tax=Aspergillus tanneri TaxID=1220188 RepID=A0A5M9N8P5_9EURO|nr:uncharacterized protein ATNIH1004_003627 [Aspergillus tanneri]KAA8650937.1 hypothetical protein ATNIH1004_003627 [Aspergillus tanneri]
MKLPLVFIAVLTAGLSNAQLGNIPRCSVNCFVNALSKDGCSELTDFSCHCQKTGLVETVTPCVRDACDQSDQVAVSSAVVQQCSQAGHPISVPPVTTGPKQTSGPTSTAGSTTSGGMGLPTACSSSPGSSSHVPSSSPASSSASHSPTSSRSQPPASSSALSTGAASHNKDNMVGAVVAAAAAVCML